jgi:hypothetical protein
MLQDGDSTTSSSLIHQRPTPRFDNFRGAFLLGLSAGRHIQIIMSLLQEEVSRGSDMSQRLHHGIGPSPFRPNYCIQQILANSDD